MMDAIARDAQAKNVKPFVGKAPAPLVDFERARTLLREAKVDIVCAKSDAHLYYLSGYAADSSLCHFYDDWACVLFPASADVPGVLIVPDYDLAYEVTRPTWLPELRAYGSEWLSAANLLKEIDAGVGIETELRQPLRDLFKKTRPKLAATMVKSIRAFLNEHYPQGVVRIGCDDPRFQRCLESELTADVSLSDRIAFVDALPVMRKIRVVKTPTEIEALRAAALINDRALLQASRAIGEDRPWRDMVIAYRRALAEEGAKPRGERGMLFNSGPDGGFVLDHDYIERMKFKRGETVLLDAIAEYRLYHADIARTAVIGAPSPVQKRMHAAVLETLSATEALLRPGQHTGELVATAADIMRKHGFNPRLTTLVFHPIGLDIFDYAKQEDAHLGWTLEANTAVNFEVFYRDAEAGGMHLEDTVVVKEGGLDYLTSLTRDLMVVQ